MLDMRQIEFICEHFKGKIDFTYCVYNIIVILSSQTYYYKNHIHTAQYLLNAYLEGKIYFNLRDFDYNFTEIFMRRGRGIPDDVLILLFDIVDNITPGDKLCWAIINCEPRPEKEDAHEKIVNRMTGFGKK